MAYQPPVNIDLNDDLGLNPVDPKPENNSDSEPDRANANGGVGSESDDNHQIEKVPTTVVAVDMENDHSTELSRIKQIFVIIIIRRRMKRKYEL